MNDKATSIAFILVGVIIGALLGKATFGFAESLTWLGLLESYDLDDFFSAEFWETIGPLKMGGGGILGGLLGHHLHKFIHNNKK